MDNFSNNHALHNYNANYNSILDNRQFTKGTAFTLEERDTYGITGLLPYSVESIEDQVKRAYGLFKTFRTPMERYLFLYHIRSTHTTLFYALLRTHITEMVPIIYTPTVGEVCQSFSLLYTRPEGMFINRHHRGKIAKVLDNWRYDVSIIVVTDGSRILGLGDLGANGMGIPIGKLSLYVVGSGFHPNTVLPITLDVGTNSLEVSANPLYIGERRKRLGDEDYYAMLDEFLMAVKNKWPKALLQFEDFSNDHCFDLLENYRRKMRCFNDDIQGTGAVVTAGFLNALEMSGVPFEEHKILVYGAGSAAIGVTNMIVTVFMEDYNISEEEAKKKFYFVDSRGLVIKSRNDLAEYKLKYARDDIKEPIKELIDIVKKVKPTAIFGLSGQGGAFTHEILSLLTQYSKHPIIFPLSNPTKNSECNAQDAYKLTHGKCIFASGSPFDPVEIDGKVFYPSQGNNMYIFPGLGFGSFLCQAKEVTDEMIVAAARALASKTSEEEKKSGKLYPDIEHIFSISKSIATSVIKKAIEQNLTDMDIPQDIPQFVEENQYIPIYK